MVMRSLFVALCLHSIALAFPHVSQKGVLRGVQSSLLPRSGRRLSQDASSCAWDDESSTCVVNDSSFFGAFGDADSDLARFIFTSFDCANRGDVSSCTADGVCTWTDDVGCLLLNIVSGRESSPCATAAPASVSILTSGELCGLQGSEGDCQAVTNCEWDASAGACGFSDFLAFHGFINSDFGAQFDQAVDAKLPPAADAFSSAFNLGDDSVDSGTVLSWEVPGSDCPDGVDSKICDYTDALFSNLLPTLFYCEGSYSDGEACDADEVCQSDTEAGGCTNADFVSNSAQNAALRSLGGSVENEIDRRVWENLQMCSEQTDPSACSAPCVWESAASVCVFSLESIAQILAESGSGDGLCDYLSVFGSAGCSFFGDADSCNQSSDCSYESDTCVLDIGILADRALEADSGLVSTLDGLSGACAGFGSASECGPS